MSGLFGTKRPDTSGMERAAAQSNALQERMYEEGIARSEPFYNIGVGGAQKLADYLGISSSPSRDSLYSTLTPQFTTITSTAPSVGDNDVMALARRMAQKQAGDVYNPDPTPFISQARNQLGADSPITTESVDYDALNAEVSRRLGEGEQRPDYYGSLLDSFSADKFQEDPGYAFRLSEGQKALERSQAARGGVLNPRAVKEMQRYNQDLASQEYGNAYNRYNIDQTNIFNRLSGMLGTGQQQAQLMTGLGQSYAANVGQTNASLANAIAGAQQAQQTGKQSMFNTLMGAGAQLGGSYLMGKALASDETLKENIEWVTEKNGHNIYHFNYIGNPQRYSGVIAQEVLKKNPDAVTTRNGKLAVYYDKLGLEMREVN